MKNILNKLVVLLLAGFALAACTEHTEYDDTGFSAVEKLLYPSDGYALDLIEQADANLYFEWEVSKVGTPVYTVVFLDAAKKEIGRYLADNNGQKSSLKMLHSQLNAIAGDAGIEPDAAGDLYWTVSAGLGGAEQLSPAEPHKLTVKRYASIDAPYHLYVTGEGSEFGTEPAAAKQMRELGDGKFEIYTRFTGSFSFINRNAAGSKRTFGVAEGRLTEGADAAGTGDGVYRVLVDFKAGTVKMEKIESVKYHWCWTPDPDAVMEYAGNGVWKRQITWDGDNRYRFDAVIDGTDYIWGYSSSDMSDSDMPSGLTGPQYRLSMRETGNINQWDYSFKHIAVLRNVTCTIVVDCSPEAEAYYHRYEFDFAPEATPVTLISPDDNASVVLNAQAGAKLTFAWNKLPDSDPAGKLTSYTLVFYSDAALEKAVGRKEAQYNGSVDVSFSELESIADAAGIAAEGTGDLYWAVESKLLSWTALSSGRKLTVTRMKGIPTAAYITGAASEFGSGYQALKALGAGKFEIFTKLTTDAAGYNFTDGDTADARKFVVEGGAIRESDASVVSSEEAIYYILLDFGAGTAKLPEDREHALPLAERQDPAYREADQAALSGQRHLVCRRCGALPEGLGRRPLLLLGRGGRREDQVRRQSRHDGRPEFQACRERFALPRILADRRCERRRCRRVQDAPRLPRQRLQAGEHQAQHESRYGALLQLYRVSGLTNSPGEARSARRAPPR